APVVDVGADQPVGTVKSTSPLLRPPVVAVYVNVSVLPVVPAPTCVGEAVSVPEPSAELLTLTLGDDARFVTVPDESSASPLVHLAEPDWPAVGAAAPVFPPPPVASP